MGFQHTDQYRQCTAKSKRSKQRCKNAAMRGRHVCRMHGGKSRRGIASDCHYHGYYSKDLYSRIVWSQIKNTWRHCVQTIRLEILKDYHSPKTLKPSHWQRYKALSLQVIRKPIPDIPQGMYTLLWDTWHDNRQELSLRMLEYLLEDSVIDGLVATESVADNQL